MNVKIGEKIKFLRKQKNISQEVLAQYLGVTFQAVSKWEKGSTMPDVATVPAIASFFGVSTDELFDFNLLEIENKVAELCCEAAQYRSSDPAKSEQMLREGLKRFPGNDVILNNLLYTMRAPERSDEVINICKSLIESTKDDAVRYEACCILAETYSAKGEYTLVKETLEQIPEIYFTKLQLQAKLLKGKDMLIPAQSQKELSAEILIDMFFVLASYYEELGENDIAVNQLVTAKRVVEALKCDHNDKDEGMETFYEYYGVNALKQIEERLALIQNK